MNQAEGLWVMDQLWKHVGMMIHHLPQKDKNRAIRTWRFEKCVWVTPHSCFSVLFWKAGASSSHPSVVTGIPHTGRSGSLPGIQPGRKWPHLFREWFHSRHGSPGRSNLCWTGYRWNTRMHPPLVPAPPPSTGRSYAEGPSTPWLRPFLRKVK